MSRAQLNKIFSKQTEDDNDDLNSTFEIDDEINVPVQINYDSALLQQKDLNTDIDFSRRAIQSMINKAQQLVEVAVNNALDSDSSEDIDVASRVIGSCVSSAEKLVSLHEKISKITKKSNVEEKSNTYIQNNTQNITLTTNELLEKILEGEQDE